MAERKPRKKSNPVVRIITLLLTAALLLGAATVVIFRDQLNIDALVRAVRYRSIARSDTGEGVSFEHSSRDTDSYALLGDNLLICSAHNLRLFSQSGTLYINESIALSQPVIRAAEDHAIVFDAGGSEYFLIRGRELIFRGSLDGSRTIISASIANDGSFAIASTERGYRGTVSRYRSANNLAVAYNFSSAFVSDCLLSSDGATLSVLTIGQEGTSFRSTLHLYQTGSDTTFAQVIMDNNVMIDLVQQKSTIWAVGENAITAISLAGEVLGSYDYTNGYLKGFSLQGDGFATLLIGKYRAGSLADVVTISNTGDVTGTLSLNEQVLALSSAGRYTAVLTYDKLQIFTEGFQTYAETTTGSAQRVLMRADGSSLLITDKTAQLYLPN